MMQKDWAILFILLLLPFSCGKKSPETITVHQEPFLQVYEDLIRLQQKITPGSPQYADSVHVIFERRDFTREKFIRYRDYYQEHPERWADFYQQLLKRLEPKSPGKPSNRKIPPPPSNRSGAAAPR
jgi:hypothetical protein